MLRRTRTRRYPARIPGQVPVDSPWTGRGLPWCPRRAASAAAPGPRGRETVARLADKLAAAEGALVVDGETAGRLLGVTARTARGRLNSLVVEGTHRPLAPA